MTLARLALGAAMILVCLHSATAQGIDPKRQQAAYCLGFVISSKAQFSTADYAVARQALDIVQHRAAIYLSLTGGFDNNTTHGMLLGKVTTDRCFAAEQQCRARVDQVEACIAEHRSPADALEEPGKGKGRLGKVPGVGNFRHLRAVAVSPPRYQPRHRDGQKQRNKAAAVISRLAPSARSRSAGGSPRRAMARPAAGHANGRPRAPSHRSGEEKHGGIKGPGEAYAKATCLPR